MYTQFMWGLANGIVVLAIAGGFFLGAAAASTPVSSVQWLGLALTALGFVLLLRGSARIRRKAAGFRLADLKQGTESERRLGRRLSLFFRWIILAEWTLFGVVSFLCHHFYADELSAPLIGLIISLHFAPLAHLFRLPPYYATAVFGAGFSVLSLALPAARLPVLCTGLGLTMWLTALDSVLRADRLAARWSGEPIRGDGLKVQRSRSG
jgi:hypothetical protein